MKEPRMGSTFAYIPFGVLSLVPQSAAYHKKLLDNYKRLIRRYSITLCYEEAEDLTCVV